VLLGAAGLLVLAYTASRELRSSPTRPVSSGRVALSGFGEIGVAITDASGKAHTLCMLAAASLKQQERGLMGVRDKTLGDHDGMLFLFKTDTKVPFWMKDTPMPLSIAYLDRRGRLVSTADMEPCGPLPRSKAKLATYDSSCSDESQTYAPSAPYRFAIEVPQGNLPKIGIGAGSHLQVMGACQPVG
jgi:hypothetical protein